MPRTTVTILIEARLNPDTVEAVRALSPSIRVVSIEDVRQNASLLAEVEVVCGCIYRDQWTRAKNLKWVQMTMAGVDRMLGPEALEHPAIITNVHIHGQPVAEHLFAMLLALTRGVHTAVRLQLDHRWDHKPILSGLDTLAGKTLGIIGLGGIGRRAAEIGVAFGMRVIGLKRAPGMVAGVEKVYTAPDRLAMLAQCDCVMAALPFTAETRHFLGEEEFCAMKTGALFLNVGRGETVDTSALVRALESGKLRGAGLDVVEPEPLPADHPLWAMPNVIITAHYAGLHPEYAARAGAVFLDNLRRYLTGQPLVNVVDKRMGY